MDHMLVGLLSAYEQPAEAIGAKQVLQQMSKSLKLTECIEDGNGQPAFIAAKQVSCLQCWLLWWCKSCAAVQKLLQHVASLTALSYYFSCHLAASVNADLQAAAACHNMCLVCCLVNQQHLPCSP